ncbi:MAG: hypothetical protein WCS94_08250 [Verrucomicrobiota bacterium]
MKTEVLNLRIPTDEYQMLCEAAQRCRVSNNALGAEMVRAAVQAIKGYAGPIIPMTLEFPLKLTPEQLSKIKK